MPLVAAIRVGATVDQLVSLWLLRRDLAIKGRKVYGRMLLDLLNVLMLQAVPVVV
jgi:hypothetical protein